MKLFATKSISKLQKYCQEYFGFALPSALWAKCISIILSKFESSFEGSILSEVIISAWVSIYAQLHIRPCPPFILFYSFCVVWISLLPRLCRFCLLFYFHFALFGLFCTQFYNLFVSRLYVYVSLCLFCSLQREQLHCKRCISYGNSVRPSVCHTPVLCQNDGT